MHHGVFFGVGGSIFLFLCCVVDAPFYSSPLVRYLTNRGTLFVE